MINQVKTMVINVLINMCLLNLASSLVEMSEIFRIEIHLHEN